MGTVHSDFWRALEMLTLWIISPMMHINRLTHHFPVSSLLYETVAQDTIGCVHNDLVLTDRRVS